MEGFVAVATYRNEVEAELAQTALASAGIQSFLKYEDMGGMLPSLQGSEGIEILVEPKDLEEARTILSQQAELGGES